MINNCKKTKIVILFPQNLTYRYNYAVHDYYSYIELKDIIPELLNNIGEIYSELSTTKLVYENTISIIGKEKIKANFFFVTENNGLVTSSSGKNVAYKLGKVYISTLDLRNYIQVMGNVKRSDNVQINQQPRPWIGLVQS